MKRRSGAARIFIYNWPVYVGTWSLSILILLLASWFAPRSAFVFAAIAAGAAVAWSLASLLISSYVYDRSVLTGGAWIPSLFHAPGGSWASVHAGLDAEVELDDVLKGPCLGRLDIFDESLMTASSIQRARRWTERAHPAAPCTPAALVLGDQSCDSLVVAFTAHEIRDARTRERFFEELRRILRPGGKLLLVEHLRDFVNFLAFGPGFLHFLPRSEWLRLAAQVRFSIAGEMRITPWVTALILERPS